MSKTEVWIEDGILYNQYASSVTLADATRLTEESLQLLGQYKLALVPLIVLLSKIDKSTFSLSIGEFGKLIRLKSIIMRLSGIWIVGARPEVKRLLQMLDKAFLGNKLRFVDKKEDAEREIKQNRSKLNQPLLEKEALKT